MMELKRVYENDDLEEPWHEVAEHNGVKIVSSWGLRALVLSEEVLIIMLSQPEMGLLSAAPDNFFSMISLATLYVILSKWSSAEHTGEALAGSSDSLLARTVDRLSLVSCSPDHSAGKCARVIEEGVSSVRRKLASGVSHRPGRPRVQQQHPSAPQKYMMGIDGDAANPNTPPNNAYMDGVAGPPHSMVPHYHPMDLQHTLPSFPMNDPNFFNSEIFFDNEFWSSFMANLSDENGLYLGR